MASVVVVARVISFFLIYHTSVKVGSGRTKKGKKKKGRERSS